MNEIERATDLLRRVKLDDVAEEMRLVAKEEILSRFGCLDDSAVRMKTGPADLVTIADEKAEERLSKVLPLLLPDSAVLGEEAVSRDLRTLDILKSDKPVWIVDPLDGTWRFRHGQPGFTMLVALAYRGRPLMGFVLNPDIHRRSDVTAQKVFMAVKGQGAFTDTFGQGRIRTPRVRVSENDLHVVWVTRAKGDKTGRPLEELPQAIGQIRSSRAIGIDFLNMALGQGVHAVAYNKCFITPWDFAAPHILLLESGCAWLQKEPQIYRAAKNESLRYVSAADEPTARMVWSRLYPKASVPTNCAR
ncbi:MAG: hypothetical protein EOM37_09150 [Proteobacteria bacterium]|jgi:fructose-1,6-bisphosphatase/inositol monophosphatase family enzyme|nr:inositol monophosphatase family protein [Alphaproteobacteria bacterium]NCC04190.1 hypothetical protein [Pseudomonadota bacterium]